MTSFSETDSLWDTGSTSSLSAIPASMIRHALMNAREAVSIGRIMARSPSPPARRKQSDQLPTRRQLKHFLGLIAIDLRSNPAPYPCREHRMLLAEMVGKIGRLNFYELLGVAPTSEDHTLLSGFFEVARLVHPFHAARLGFAGKEEVLLFLFERVTQAYLTLIDARRRAGYNLLQGLQRTAVVADSERQREKRRLALCYYRQAKHHLTMMDYSAAIDLLREAARLDPQAEYLALLAKTQAINPHWYEDAISSYQEAIELSPEDATLHVELAELLEKASHRVAAQAEYEAALEISPNQPEARLALLRFSDKPPQYKMRCTMPSLRNLFPSIAMS